MQKKYFLISYDWIFQIPKYLLTTVVNLDYRSVENYKERIFLSCCGNSIMFLVRKITVKLREANGSERDACEKSYL